MKRTLIFNAVICILVLFTLQTTYSEYERKVVFEEFTEVWCGPCASIAPSLGKWLEDHPEVIPIMYSSYFMENGIKIETPKEEYQKRATFYNVPFYPYGRLNGNSLPPNEGYPGFPTDTAGMTALIDTMAKTSSAKIELDCSFASVDNYQVEVTIKSDVEISNKLLHVFLIEKEHEYPKQSNGMTHFHDIFRKTATPISGENITLEASGSRTFQYSADIECDIESGIYAIAILQDPVSHYIIQSERVYALPVSVTDKDDQNDKISIYPNPANEYIEIDMSEQEYLSCMEQGLDIIICNGIGEEMIVMPWSQTNSKLQINISTLPNGSYYIRLGDKVEKFIKK